MRKDPEPPPFWPSNLPFSSNLGDISTKSKKNTGKPERPGLETSGRGPPSITPAKASKQSPQDSHLPKDYTPPPTFSPSSLPPLNNRPTNNLTHDAGRPSHLPCNASAQDPPLKSPSQAGTPGNGHSQLPKPPPYTPPITTSQSPLCQLRPNDDITLDDQRGCPDSTR
ncbi:hypothetical protein GBAR_LOCUS20898 [Geodia barretti]|uniref:Uncharacterized protein n=1 Tax=Geodia barretti TaxID=519541 RepID=A0AA35X440_GEOBA|nr:hypothetical protein GBAR_LOCUS20898 [Geodia barretti]